jgi:GSCFA family protein
MLQYKVGGRRLSAPGVWYRGENTNYNPKVATMRSARAVEDYILLGWLPPEPFITPNTKITAFGSCFAAHISDHLNRRNYTILTKTDANAYVVTRGEGIVNSYAMRQQFDWAFRGLTPQTELWHGYKAENHGYDESVRLTTLELFNQTEVFILTFGLSEVWYDEPTGEVFWRAVPADVFDPERHKFRVSTVAENKANIRAIYDTIREFRPDARIVFTLSPIPLVATFRPVSCITANSVSKAILRAAIDEVYRDVGHEGKLFYWPSYEIVEQAFGAGKYTPDRRHIRVPILDYVMALFESNYCLLEPPLKSLNEARLLAMQSANEISSDVLRVARSNGSRVISVWTRRKIAEDDLELAELVLLYSLELHPHDEVRRRLLELVRSTKPQDVDADEGRSGLHRRARQFVRRHEWVKSSATRIRRHVRT